MFRKGKKIMELNKLIGEKVVNTKKNATGDISSVDVNNLRVVIDYGNGPSSTSPLEGFVKGWFKLNNAQLQIQVEAEVKKLLAAKNNQQKTDAQNQRIQKQQQAVNNAQQQKQGQVKSALAGTGYPVQHLKMSPKLTYQQVQAQFGIKITGFGRGINVTNDSIVLISSVDRQNEKFVYHDRYDQNGDYFFSGEGKCGDQKLTGGNRAIVDSKNGGISIHLFVKFSPSEYYYQGEFYLVDYTLEDELDESGKLRKEYKFRLRPCIRRP